MQNPKVVLIAIALLFFVPLLLAVLMRSGWWDFQPSSLSNRGTLVQPITVFPFEATEPAHGTHSGMATEQWRLVYTLPPGCAENCLHTLAALRQVHLALGRERERVAMLLLAPSGLDADLRAAIARIHADFQLRVDTHGDAAALLGRLAGPDRTPFGTQPGQAFLLDPGANIILRYAPGFDPQDISHDLDRLLTWTQGA